MCEAAYATFHHPAVAPLRQIDERRFLLELFHGPTLAFKDVAMQLLARLYEHGLERRGERLTIVCATSGDTGGAAAEAFAGRDNIDLVCLYPEGRISAVQRRFMTATGADNVRAVSVEGDFDLCQALLKALFADRALAGEIGLAAVNSINIARVIAQIVYYFTAAVALGAPARPVSFVVPTGNLGDAYAGWAARAMGLPIARLVVATNSNAIVAEAIATGVYRRGATLATQSPAMDIQVASNFERLLYDCTGQSGPAVAAAFEAFARDGVIRLDDQALSRLRGLLDGVSVSEAETSATIRAAYEAGGLLVDPHTAVALAGSIKAASPMPTVVLSTAHPAKFPDAVEAASGVASPPPAAVAARAGRAEVIDPLPADLATLKAYLRRVAGVTA